MDKDLMIYDGAIIIARYVDKVMEGYDDKYVSIFGTSKIDELSCLHNTGVMKALINEGYRKVGKDDILISKEAYYEALNAAQESGKRMGYAQGRDETAREILQEIQQMDGFSCDYDIDDIVLKIANKYGIELEE